MGNMRGVIIVAASVLIVAGASTAIAETAPKQIVEMLYHPYLGDSHADKAEPPAALDAISKYASKSLLAAIRKEEACQRRTKGICNIDSDIIISGQDWSLSDLVINDGDLASQRPVVRADFKNFTTKSRVSFDFVREGSAWKIDDVESVDYNENGAAGDTFFLKKTLLTK
jgi:hypothetical protein